jgi:signal transduction histidine kinase
MSAAPVPWPPAAAENWLSGERLVMNTPIPDPDHEGQVLGRLVGVLDWRRVTGLTATVRHDLAAQGLSADVLVCASDGEVIGGARSDGEVTPERRAGLAAALAAGDGDAPGWTVHAGSDLIVGRARLAPDLPEPFSGWSLAVVESRAHALAPARRLSHRLLGAMGLVLLLAVGVAALAARRVVRPLSELTAAIRGLASGDAGARRVPVRGDDELGILARAFNQMADDLDRAQHELVEAEKFAFVGELAAGVAHEIRTSLGVLRSSAQILQRSLPEDVDPETGELAQMIGAEVGRLGGVVEDLLTLDRAHPLRLENVPVSDPVFRAADFVGPRALEKGLAVDREPCADEPRVRCEPELVHQVAVNLLVNAIQALAPGGRIRVRILPERDGFGGFEIHDDGAGIPLEIREKIFQPFVTRSRDGVGLGLTFVKRVVHEHRGRVGVESGPDRGTTFRVELPVGAPRDAEETT